MKRLRQFALFAVVGQAVFLGSAWLLPLASEYGLVGDNISELVLGRYGWVQTLTFVISGLGIICLAYALSAHERRPRIDTRSVTDRNLWVRCCGRRDLPDRSHRQQS